MAEYIKLWRSEMTQPAEEYGVWCQLLLLAARSDQQVPYGTIAITPEVGYPDDLLAKLTGTNTDNWKLIKASLIAKKQLKVHGDNIINIVNWQKYQSEKLRKLSLGRSKGPSQGPSLEREIEIEIERKPLSENYDEVFTEKQRTRWLTAYPLSPKQREWDKALAWLAANPNRQKKNMAAFFNNWLSSCEKEIISKLPKVEERRTKPAGPY